MLTCHLTDIFSDTINQCVWGDLCVAPLRDKGRNEVQCGTCLEVFHPCCLPRGAQIPGKVWCGICVERDNFLSREIYNFTPDETSDENSQASSVSSRGGRERPRKQSSTARGNNSKGGRSLGGGVRTAIAGPHSCSSPPVTSPPMTSFSSPMPHPPSTERTTSFSSPMPHPPSTERTPRDTGREGPDKNFLALMTMMGDLKEQISTMGQRCDETMVVVQALAADLKDVKESTANQLRTPLQVFS